MVAGLWQDIRMTGSLQPKEVPKTGVNCKIVTTHLPAIKYHTHITKDSVIAC
jgi:hypothetical protein